MEITTAVVALTIVRRNDDTGKDRLTEADIARELDRLSDGDTVVEVGEVRLVPLGDIRATFTGPRMQASPETLQRAAMELRRLQQQAQVPQPAPQTGSVPPAGTGQQVPSKRPIMVLGPNTAQEDAPFDLQAILQAKEEDVKVDGSNAGLCYDCGRTHPDPMPKELFDSLDEEVKNIIRRQRMKPIPGDEPTDGDDQAH